MVKILLLFSFYQACNSQMCNKLVVKYKTVKFDLLLISVTKTLFYVHGSH